MTSKPPFVEQFPERPSMNEGTSRLLRQPDGDRAEHAAQPMHDDTRRRTSGGACVAAARERAIRVVVADDGDLMSSAHECARERLHCHRITAEASRRIERGDHAEAKRRHETAGMGAARRPIVTTRRGRRASHARSLAR